MAHALVRDMNSRDLAATSGDENDSVSADSANGSTFSAACNIGFLTTTILPIMALRWLAGPSIAALP